MELTKQINPRQEVIPRVYAYVIPDYPKRAGWVKIGYTERDVDKRIHEQSGTIGVDTKTLWHYIARFNEGGYFTDRDFHGYLVKNGIEREKAKEWFNFGVGNEKNSQRLFMDFTFQKYEDIQKSMQLNYTLRSEQEEAVQMAFEYAQENPNGEFLWNAKPRFGKTLSSYELMRRLNAVNVLVVTNRPAIANSWFDDFEKFIAWQTDYVFVSESDSLKDRKPLTRDEFVALSAQKEDIRQVNFVSLQDLKGSIYHGGVHDKLEYISAITWDLLIIDEAHEGVDTFKTDFAFDAIKRKFTLHLSGTPFKAIAKGKFSEKQIFNWSYEDEQEAKGNWNEEGDNPYEVLPRLNMFTYQMSNMIREEVNRGAEIDGEEMDYAFDLNEFFATDSSGKFIHEEDVIKWLDTLTHNEKYPFSSEELRNELKHSFWLLNRVASAKAMAKLLNDHPIFCEYEVIVAAGDGKTENDMDVNERSLSRVKDAIAKFDKTITLSVGQLTTGVTIPEWTAVLMLSNMQSASLYMQAAFRSQNPPLWVETVNGKDVAYRKQNAYVFDFAPERTLIIFDEFANSLNPSTSAGGGTSSNREENIKRLLNFFPIIGEDSNGVMRELDYKDVLTIPKKIKATEVVRRGFMSNLLFANISGIFSAPQVVLDTLNELIPEAQGKQRKTKETVDTSGVEVDEKGDVKVDKGLVINTSNAILGEKIFEKEEVKLPEKMDEIPSNDLIRQATKAIIEAAKLDDKLGAAKENLGATVNDISKAKREMEGRVQREVERKVTETNIQKHRIEKEYQKNVKKAESQEEKQKLEQTYHESVDYIFESMKNELFDNTHEVIEQVNEEFVEEQIKKDERKKKDSIEDDVRGRLRGFARTIPSFIMAYGEEDLTLQNFDTHVPAHVFKDVTGITIEQFKFLRDGGEYEEEGEVKHYKGHLFDEVVFNESIQEFLRKKSELADYFEDHEEDIFDYIPPQETNQIYTPKHVVKRMVDALEKENPSIYDDGSKTFIDLYMKSGLYITEIVKKLYNSEVLKQKITNDETRIKHILENQVYGFAPSEIIYNIATNFIFGELNSDIDRGNFVQVDTVPYAKNGTIQDLIDEKFGGTT